MQWRKRYTEFSKTLPGQVVFLSAVFFLFWSGIAWRLLNFVFIAWWLSPFIFLPVLKGQSPSGKAFMPSESVQIVPAESLPPYFHPCCVQIPTLHWQVCERVYHSGWPDDCNELKKLALISPGIRCTPLTATFVLHYFP